MATGEFKSSKPELVAIYRLEFYKNKNKWKFNNERRKESAQPATRSSSKSVKTACRDKLNKTYEVDPSSDSEKENSPLNNAFMHQIPTDDTPEDEPIPPPFTSQPSEEDIWVHQGGEAGSKASLVMSTNSGMTTGSLPLLHEVQTLEALANQLQIDATQQSRPTTCTNQADVNLQWQHTNNQEQKELWQPASNVWTNEQTPGSKHPQTQGLWTKPPQIISNLQPGSQNMWPTAVSPTGPRLFNHNPWSIPPPNLPVRLQDKETFADLLKSHGENDFKQQVTKLVQTPPPNCLQMLLCPETWQKQACPNTQKYQDQFLSSPPTDSAIPNPAPVTEPQLLCNQREMSNQQNICPDSFTNIEPPPSSPIPFNNRLVSDMRTNKQSILPPDNWNSKQSILPPDNWNSKQSILPPDNWNSKQSIPPPDNWNSKQSIPPPDNWNSKQSIPPPDNWNSKQSIPPPDNWNSKQSIPPPDNWNSKQSIPPPDNWNSKQSISPPDNWNKKQSIPPPDNWTSKQSIPPTDNWNSKQSISPPDNWNSKQSIPPPDNWTSKQSIPPTDNWNSKQNISPPDNWNSKQSIPLPDNWTSKQTIPPTDNWTIEARNGTQFTYQGSFTNQGSLARPQRLVIPGHMFHPEPNIKAPPPSPETCSSEAWCYPQKVWTDPPQYVSIEPSQQNAWTHQAWRQEEGSWQNRNQEWGPLVSEDAPDGAGDGIRSYSAADQNTLKGQGSLDGEALTAEQIRRSTDEWLGKLLALYQPKDESEAAGNQCQSASGGDESDESSDFVRGAHDAPHSSELDPDDSRECVCAYLSPASLPALPPARLDGALAHAARGLRHVLREQLLRDRLRTQTIQNIVEYPTRDTDLFECECVEGGSHVPRALPEPARPGARGARGALGVPERVIKIAMGRPYRL